MLHLHRAAVPGVGGGRQGVRACAARRTGSCVGEASLHQLAAPTRAAHPATRGLRPPYMPAKAWQAFCRHKQGLLPAPTKYTYHCLGRLRCYVKWEWGVRRVSNPQPPDPQSGALPLSYGHHTLASIPATAAAVNCFATGILATNRATPSVRYQPPLQLAPTPLLPQPAVPLRSGHSPRR